MQFAAPIPILRIFNEPIAKAFYVDFLGFTIDWEHRFADDMPLYCQISKGACIIHLSEHHGDATPGSAIRIQTPDIDAFQQILIAKQYKNARPGVVDQPWGAREMGVHDPFHNRLIFYQNIES
jgi:uncharacterized glyoxalase superfamily protein PhnB